MEKRKFTPYIVLFVVLGLAIILCAFTTVGVPNESLPVASELPSHVNGYAGSDILYCQDEQCMHTCVSPAQNVVTCPLCDAPLDPVSLAEKRLLPKDTLVKHRLYKSPSGSEIFVSMVIGGHERRSIHKPQVCLVAQGHQIDMQRAVEMEMRGDHDLEVAMLELDGGRSVYFYWFTNGEVETASHLVRLFRTAWDGVVHNKRARWAYISLYLNQPVRSLPMDEVEAFVRALYPKLLANHVISDGAGSRERAGESNGG